MQIKNSNRNSNVELLRFLLMFGICIHHMFVHGKGLAHLETGGVIILQNVDFVLMSMVIPSVNCFMLISGYYGIKFTFEKLVSFIIQGFLVYVIANTILFHFGIISMSDILKFEFFRGCLTVSNRNWWFMTDYVTIMLLSPFINKGIECLEKQQYKKMLVFLYILNLGMYVATTQAGYNLLWLLFIYLLGSYIRRYGASVKLSTAVLLYIIPTIILTFVLRGVHQIGTLDYKLIYLQAYCNPIVLAQSFGIIYIILAFKSTNNSFFTFLGRHCFLIYLVTDGSRFVLYRWWTEQYDKSIGLGLLSILFVCAVCIVVDIPFNFLVRYIVKILDKTRKLIPNNKIYS